MRSAYHRGYGVGGCYWYRPSLGEIQKGDVTKTEYTVSHANDSEVVKDPPACHPDVALNGGHYNLRMDPCLHPSIPVDGVCSESTNKFGTLDELKFVVCIGHVYTVPSAGSWEKADVSMVCSKVDGREASSGFCIIGDGHHESRASVAEGN